MLDSEVDWITTDLIHYHNAAKLAKISLQQVTGTPRCRQKWGKNQLLEIFGKFLKDNS